MRVVVALGDGAVRRETEPPTVEGQRAAVAAACAYLAPVAEVHELVIAHGSGPQAGLLSLSAPVHDVEALPPSDASGSLAEGMIGYLLEQELSNLLPDQLLGDAMRQLLLRDLEHLLLSLFRPEPAGEPLAALLGTVRSAAVTEAGEHLLAHGRHGRCVRHG